MKRSVTITLLLAVSLTLTAQIDTTTIRFRAMCYNVENYFDCLDDSLTNDAEYLPGGMRGWSNSRYRAKQANIARVVAAIGGWDAPALVGLCEIENRNCLLGLTRGSMKNMDYQIVHHESPDARGIDVALLYQPNQFTPLSDEAIRITFPTSKSTTRDILYVKGLAAQADTLHVFICHFPSRLGGELESEDRRLHVASCVRHKTDSILAANSQANILIMGDFNDYPTNRSMYDVLGAHTPTDTTQLHNMMLAYDGKNMGSHKFQGEWGCLDQIVISTHLLNGQGRLHTTQNNVHIFTPDWLLTDDTANLGKQPFRTYTGYKYNGGFSDHLPVYIDFTVQSGNTVEKH